MRNIFYPQTMSIRVPALLKKLIDAEASKRGFDESDEKSTNRFYNKMLPNIIQHRKSKKNKLRAFLERSVKASISKAMQEKVIDSMTEYFDYSYFEEDDECDDTINIRFNVRNEDFYAELFTRIEDAGMKRSTYIRNLLNEYFAMPDHQRERVCFYEEYDKLNKALFNNLTCQFTLDKSTQTAIIMAIQYSVRMEHWYVLYFYENQFNIIYSTPLYKFKNILCRGKSRSEPSADISRRINMMIDEGIFADSSEFIIGGNHDA